MGPDRYRRDTIRLEKSREPEQLVREITTAVRDQGGIATFRLYGRSGRQLAQTLKDLLDPDYDVLLLLPDRESFSARHHDWYRRHVTELLGRTPRR